MNAPCPMIVPYDPYLLAVLNSKLGDWYVRQLGVTRNGGYFEYKPCFVERLPVPQIPQSQRTIFRRLVDRAQAQNGASAQMEIDAMVYELYELSPREIEHIAATS